MAVVEEQADVVREGISNAVKDKIISLQIKNYKELVHKVVKIIIPVRCFSCGRVVGHLYDEYKKRVAAGEHAGKVLDQLGLKRFCCRQLFLGHVDLLKDVAKFKP